MRWRSRRRRLGPGQTLCFHTPHAAFTGAHRRDRARALAGRRDRRGFGRCSRIRRSRPSQRGRAAVEPITTSAEKPRSRAGRGTAQLIELGPPTPIIRTRSPPSVDHGNAPRCSQRARSPATRRQRLKKQLAQAALALARARLARARETAQRRGRQAPPARAGKAQGPSCRASAGPFALRGEAP